MYQIQSDYIYVTVFAAIFLAGVAVSAMSQRIHHRLPAPPGPPGHHLLTNLSFKETHQKLSEWTETYGPVFTLRQGKTPLVVITRYEAAAEIMGKKGASLADRPRWIAAGEILSGGMRTLLQSSGTQFRKRRKALHSHLHINMAKQYEPIQARHAKNVVLDILEAPENHAMHAKRYAASVIMSMTYGKETPTSYSDPEVVKINTYLARVRDVVNPGAYLVDTYPILQYLPGYSRELRRWHHEELSFFKEQLDVVRKDLVDGIPNPSFSKYLIENQKEIDLSGDELAYLAGSMFGAGATTTAAAIDIMIMAAAKYPEAQKKVQQELDSVVGHGRVPTFADEINLPQVAAFALETLRWRPVSDLGFPHRASKDVLWRNYMIPKGASVVGSPWEIGRDPSQVVDGDTFNPQRWLDSAGHLREDIKFFGFGFGRRVCPGQHVAKGSVFINTAFILWAFNVSELFESPIDTMEFVSSSSSSSPKPFSAKFDSRLDEMELKKVLNFGQGG